MSYINRIKSDFSELAYYEQNFASSQYLRIVRRHIRYVLDPPAATEEKTGERGKGGRGRRKRDFAREWRMMNELLDLKPGAKPCDTARYAIKVELTADQSAWLDKYRTYVPESMRGKMATRIPPGIRRLRYHVT
jgi:hypothetical protein